MKMERSFKTSACQDGRSRVGKRPEFEEFPALANVCFLVGGTDSGRCCALDARPQYPGNLSASSCSFNKVLNLGMNGEWIVL